MQTIIGRIDELLATKAELENMMDVLTQIDTLSQNNALAGPDSQSAQDLGDILALKERVTALDVQLKPLAAEATRQASELDALLDEYEAAVSFLYFFLFTCSFALNF